MQNDTVKRPLTPNYKGSFKVISWADKYFTIKCNNNIGTIATDRLKLAVMEKIQPNSTPSPSPQPTEHHMPPCKHIKSGKKVTFYKHFKTYIFSNWYNQLKKGLFCTLSEFQFLNSNGSIHLHSSYDKNRLCTSGILLKNTKAIKNIFWPIKKRSTQFM